MSHAPTTVAGWLRGLPSGRRADAAALVALIRRCAPRAHEAIERGRPAWALPDGPLFALEARERSLTLHVSEPDLLEHALPALGHVVAGRARFRFAGLASLELGTLEELLAAAYDRRQRTPGPVRRP